ncbi:hypothetical protein D9613_008372 [Agrocybe pediades]|uniref:RRM domain-containing protein n=1 Tax=Agrocybe pediades TaxID=84607 RepID=A0A8H4VP13_9AGAR|nr:hypothetical protein D9613_008372 [Agrocybe pediades]
MHNARQLQSPGSRSNHSSSSMSQSPGATQGINAQKGHGNSFGAENDHDTELEEGESSDIEILLDAQNVQDSKSLMHVLPGSGKGSPGSKPAHPQIPSLNEVPQELTNTIFDATRGQQHQTFTNTNSTSISSTVYGLQATNSNSDSSTSAKTLSPLPLTMPLSSSPSQNPLSQHRPQPQHQYGSVPNSQSNSPQNAPSAPVHSTVPLPEMEDYDQTRDAADARQLQHQHQHQQMHGAQGDPNDVYGAAIDLSGLSISGDNRSQQQQQQHVLGMPTSQTLPAISTTFNSVSPGGSSPSSGFPASASDSALGSAGQKTPNVYINGLPPHFPEDQLFALASPFGEIRSVRTFTRHVRDSESGYGFVLFETIDAAERCIVSLRRYRNLHPTFSKQIHKIPGTTYAGAPSQSSSWEGQALVSDGSSRGGSLNGELSSEASFKAKMESLQDPTSTNLYMEGLPLSIDEPTLAALVSPHRIISSRFFQTRLSNPPRIIAFVRLETREGAEEIIERLHGRMVRGMNDTGSRISVRFADTSEQRELRRQERAAQEGDVSPARLTIAQAALLNLRGQELRPNANTGSVIHAHGNGVGRIPSSGYGGGFETSVSAPEFSSNLSHVPVIGTTGANSTLNLEVDYSLVPGGGGVSSSSRSRSPYHAPYQQYSPYVAAHQPLPSTVDPAMSALLDSLRSNGVPYQSPASGGYGSGGEVNYMQNHGMGFGQGLGQLHASQSLGDLQQYARPAPVYTRSGYTPTEEYIMRAHAESAAQAQAQQQASERRRPAPLDLRRRRTEEDIREEAAASIAVGVRGYRTQASLGRVGQSLLSPPLTAPLSTSPMMGMTSMANTMAEDDFHTSAAVARNSLRTQRSFTNDEGGDIDRTIGSSARARHNPNIHPAHVNARLSRDPTSSVSSQYEVQRPPMPLSPSVASPAAHQDSTDINDAIQYQHAAAHLRSTTLPQHRSSSARDGQQQAVRGHYQHNSMSMPAQNLRTPQHASVATLAGTRGIDAAGGNAGPGTSGTIYESDGQEQQQQQQQQQQQEQQPLQQHQQSNNGSTGSQPNPLRPHFSSSPLFGEMSDNSTSSPSLISPTLTYSSQTPSTMSPATPFFGTFNSQTDGFEKNGFDQGQHPHPHQQHLAPGKKTIAPGGMNPSSLRTITSEGR